MVGKEGRRRGTREDGLMESTWLGRRGGEGGHVKMDLMESTWLGRRGAEGGFVHQFRASVHITHLIDVDMF